MTISTPSLFQSKKFGAAALASILSFFGLRYGMTVEQLAIVTGPLGLFIVGQGIADIGKEKAKAENPLTHTIGNVSTTTPQP